MAERIAIVGASIGEVRAAQALRSAGHRGSIVLVDLADGDELRFEGLVVATGARARLAPWRADCGVHVLRTLDDSSRLSAAPNRTGPVAVVGGGSVGAKVAAAACSSGRAVTIVDPLTAPAGNS